MKMSGDPGFRKDQWLDMEYRTKGSFDIVYGIRSDS